jgi:hypothetical protein
MKIVIKIIIIYKNKLNNYTINYKIIITIIVIAIIITITNRNRNSQNLINIKHTIMKIVKNN